MENEWIPVNKEKHWWQIWRKGSKKETVNFKTSIRSNTELDERFIESIVKDIRNYHRKSRKKRRFDAMILPDRTLVIFETGKGNRIMTIQLDDEEDIIKDFGLACRMVTDCEEYNRSINSGFD